MFYLLINSSKVFTYLCLTFSSSSWLVNEIIWFRRRSPLLDPLEIAAMANWFCLTSSWWNNKIRYRKDRHTKYLIFPFSTNVCFNCLMQIECLSKQGGHILPFPDFLNFPWIPISKKFKDQEQDNKIIILKKIPNFFSSGWPLFWISKFTDFCLISQTTSKISLTQR